MICSLRLTGDLAHLGTYVDQVVFIGSFREIYCLVALAYDVFELCSRFTKNVDE